MLGLLYADNLVLCGWQEEDLREMVEHYTEVCKRCLKLNANMSKVRVLGGEEGLEWEVYSDGMRLEHVLEFKYLGFFYTNQIKMRQSVMGRWQMRGGLQVLLGPWLMLGI